MNQNPIGQNPLGKDTEYTSRYSPEKLFAIARVESRKNLHLNSDLPFYGVDVWTAYELSWLDPSGKPQVALVKILVPCTSESIVESKSLKLYLNSFNQTHFVSYEEVRKRIQDDLSHLLQGKITVFIYPINSAAIATEFIVKEFTAELLDDLFVTIDQYHPSTQLLRLENNADRVEVVNESLVSHLLKTNCPVTGQPDWASVLIRYQGQKINRESLLKYVISFREHQDFHENCVERIFCDILQQCQPKQLTVDARYTRRGGLDINPFRSTEKTALPETIRLIRQ
jgi:7-cyano-7-deazaguanine reductase